MSINIGDFVYYTLIYNWISGKIDQFSNDVIGRTMLWASAIALTAATVWIMIQGYRMVTGRSRESMSAMVVDMGKIAVIIAFATNMSFFGTTFQDWFTNKLGSDINYLVTGENTNIQGTIDQNLAYMQLAMAAVDAVQIPAGDTATLEDKSRTMLIATLGTAGPAVTAGALLLMYKLAIALVIGLAPIFIMCLIFDFTKDLFKRWVLYGVGTLFSFAVLNFVVALALKLCIALAEATWASSLINKFLDLGNTGGLTSQAMQQGGVGLLMTLLIITTPAMAAAFFNGTLGTFYSYSQVNNSGPVRGPQGQAPGTYGGGDYAPPPTTLSTTNQAQVSTPRWTQPPPPLQPKESAINKKVDIL